MRALRSIWMLLVALLAAAPACSSDKSFVLVHVRTTAGEIAGVSELVVTVRNGPERRDQLRYRTGATTMRLSREAAVSFSVSFSSSYSGRLEVGVVPIGANGAPLGFGTATVPIERKDVAEVPVFVEAGRAAEGWALPGGGDAGVVGDGATADGGPGRADAGTDAQLCEPTNAAMCGAGNTCAYLSCGGAGEPRAQCTRAGTKAPGQVCTSNAECAPGSQCFEFACAASPVRICLPFCTQDDQCGAGGRCFASVKCGERSTSSRRCAPACDPRGEATTGCAPGLRCFLLENDVTDCECASDAGEGRDGAKCTTSANCAPGFFCVDQKGDRACRALCRMAEPTCPAGYSCNELRDPGSKLFGTCEPI